MPYQQTRTQCVVCVVCVVCAAWPCAVSAQRSCRRVRRCARRLDASGRIWTDLDGSGDAAGPGTGAGAVVERERVGAGDQGRPVCAPQPDGAGAVSEGHRQRANVATATDLRRQEVAATGRIQTHPDASRRNTPATPRSTRG
jgi:hypothetical protein